LSKSQALIAVVDDEDPVRRALRRLLRSAGLEVEEFASGVEFLNSLGRGLPDCVVLHEHYPGFLLEFKRPGGRLRAAQQKLIWELRQAYHLRVAVVDSVAMLEAFLEDHERSP